MGFFAGRLQRDRVACYIAEMWRVRHTGTLASRILAYSTGKHWRAWSRKYMLSKEQASKFLGSSTLVHDTNLFRCKENVAGIVPPRVAAPRRRAKCNKAPDSGHNIHTDDVVARLELRLFLERP